MKIHKLSAYGLGAFVLTFGATLAFGQARVPFTRPPYIVTPGSITLGAEQPLCLNGPVCTSNIQTDSGTWVNFRRNSQNYIRFSPSDLIISDKPHYFTSNAQSNVASGNQAFTCTNVGCRLSLGSTARYFYDTGVDIGLTGANLYLGSATQLIYVAKIQEPNQNATLTLVGGKSTSAADSVGITLQTRTQSVAGAKIASFQNGTSEVSFIDYLGNMSGTSYTATATSGSSFTGGNSSNVMTLTSNTTDAVTSGTVPAIRLQASQNITDTDLLMSVEDSAGNRRLTVSELGALATGGTITISGGSGTAVGRYFIGTTTPVEIGTNMAIGTEKAPVRLYAFNTFTADDVSLVSIRNGGSGSTEVAHFSKDGLLRVNEANAAKPTCNADNRGRIFFLDGASGAADVFEVCGKDATNAYSWKSIVTW